MKKFFFLLLVFLLVPSWKLAEKLDRSNPFYWLHQYGSIKKVSQKNLEKLVLKDGPLGTWARLSLADVLMQSGFSRPALGLVQDFNPGWGFWKSVLLAEGFLSTGEFEKAEEILKNISPLPDLTSKNAAGFYMSLYQRLLVVGSKLPDEKKALEFSQKLKATRLHILASQKKWVEIPFVISLEDISSLSEGEKCLAFMEYGDAYRYLQNKEKSLEAYGMAASLSCPDKIFSRVLFWKSSLEVKLKKWEDVLKTGQIFIKNFPDHQFTDDTYDALAKAYDALGKKEEAKKMRQHFSSLKSGDIRDKKMWEEAWPLYKKQNCTEAVKFLDKIIEAKNDGTEARPQALYWKAKCLEKIPAFNSLSQMYLQTILIDYSFSFYAVLSSDILKWKLPAFTKIDHKIIEKFPDEKEILTTVDFLYALGLKEEAIKLLDYLSLNKSTDTSLKPILAWYWMRLEEYNRTLFLAADYFGRSAYSVDFDAGDPMVNALFPKAFEESISLLSQKAGIPEYLAYAIMREESSFDPEIGSSAGAIGLMQLMPGTAKDVAAKISLPDFDTTQLTNPETNILLGTNYLRHVLDLFDGFLPHAIASYNAGPGNVKKWIKKNGHLPFDEFVEEIPFGETRGYVKRVMRSVFVYRSILGK